ncbi:di-heme enzyme [Shewanella corallii]|uniref:Di-heme enzyme n=1 Tax=Shewanella corallii TaxID=560080 RepID=A0ABT0N1T2_9GAMM|nr:MbnH family di-heme enzyme [Shewanella corallii]MCL2912381.1 di-heme enzyme [Shewanella corallii]
MTGVKETGLLIIMLGLVTLPGCLPSQEPTEETQVYQWALPDDFPLPQVPPENPMSDAKVELGRYLFYDRALSANQRQSCASCHLQSHAFAEPLRVSTGSTGEQHRRNAPALVNIAYNKNLTWAHNGLTQIERQVLIPLFGQEPIEMGVSGHEQQVLQRLTRAPYPELFIKAYGEAYAGTPEFIQVTQALSSFVRSLISLSSPFDRYAYYEDDYAINDQVRAGMKLFFSERMECHHCHGGFNFTQSTSHQKQPLDRRPFHNIGLYYTSRTKLTDDSQGYPDKDRGLGELTGKPQDDGRFRAPTLRNIALTAPYMHDGSVASLEEVIEIYAAGGREITSGPFAGDGRRHPFKSPFVNGFDISAQEKQDLIAFLNSLTDESFISNPAFSDPWPATEQMTSLK